MPPNSNRQTIMLKIQIILLNSFVENLKPFWFQTYRKMGYAPSTLAVLRQLVPDSINAKVTIIDEGTTPVEFDNIDADLVALSVLTPNAPRAYRIAKILQNKGIKVVMGGAHPTLMPDEAMQYADAIITGYAESAWPELLIDFVSGNMKKIYSGNWSDVFKIMPYPFFSAKETKKYLLPYVIETSRGCNNSCNFCMIPEYDKQIRYCARPIDRIIKDLTPFKNKHIALLDSNPFENTEYSKELLKAMIPLRIKWFSNISFKKLYDDEWIRLASLSGCKGVLVGFESINQDSLNDQCKQLNETAKYREFIKKLHKNGIGIIGSFMFGFDHDDLSVFRNTCEFVNETAIDMIHYAIVTPFPGTKEYARLLSLNRIIDNDWSHYNGIQVVFKPEKMTIEQLQNGFYWAYRNTHSYKSIFKRVLKSRNSVIISLLFNYGLQRMGNATFGDFYKHIAKNDF